MYESASSVFIGQVVLPISDNYRDVVGTLLGNRGIDFLQNIHGRYKKITSAKNLKS